MDLKLIIIKNKRKNLFFVFGIISWSMFCPSKSLYKEFRRRKFSTFTGIRTYALHLPTLVKGSDWNSFHANQIHSDSFRNLFPHQSELIRINPKKVFNLVWCNPVKN